MTLHTFSLDPQPCTWLREEEANGEGKPVSKKAPKRGRGVAIHDEGRVEEEEKVGTSKDTAKKAKVTVLKWQVMWVWCHPPLISLRQLCCPQISALWEQLKQGSPVSRCGGGIPVQPSSKSLAALCRSAPTSSSRNDKNRVGGRENDGTLHVYTCMQHLKDCAHGLQNWMKQLGFAPKAAEQPGSSGCPPPKRSVALEPAHTIKLESQQCGGQQEEGAGAGEQVEAQYQWFLAFGCFACTHFSLHVLFCCMTPLCWFTIHAARARSVSSRSRASCSKGGCLISRAPAGSGH